MSKKPNRKNNEKKRKQINLEKKQRKLKNKSEMTEKKLTGKEC